jgi:hypothetical protein
MFKKLFYLYLINTKRNKLTYNIFYNNYCNYTINNVSTWIINFENSCKDLLSNNNC